MDCYKCIRLLVADDDESSLAAYKAFFGGHGFPIRTASDGGEAMRHGSRWRPRVVILDIEMPVASGRDVARHLRAMNLDPATILVAVSGLSGRKERDVSISAGFDITFVKPVSLPAVLAAISDALRQQDLALLNAG